MEPVSWPLRRLPMSGSRLTLIGCTSSRPIQRLSRFILARFVSQVIIQELAWTAFPWWMASRISPASPALRRAA